MSDYKKKQEKKYKKKLSVKQYEWKNKKERSRSRSRSRGRRDSQNNKDNNSNNKGFQVDDSWKEMTDKNALKFFATEALKSHKILCEWSPEELAQAEQIKQRVQQEEEKRKQGGIEQGFIDMRHLPWVSIDNDDTRDIDQLTATETLPNGNVRGLVAVADVGSFVPASSPLDRHASNNTASVYTPSIVFTMFPEIMCYNLTSLMPNEDRKAHIIEMVFESKTSAVIVSSTVYLGIVRNKAKLAYKSISKWLNGKGECPVALSSAPNTEILQETIKIQDSIAQAILAKRQNRGTLEFENAQPEVIFTEEKVTDIIAESQNRAQKLIENFMVSANETVSNFLRAKGFPSIQRVVKNPEKWQDIMKYTESFKYTLPPHPDSRALRQFLKERREADQVTFPDVSLTVIKLLGRGEYVFTKATEESPGHFALSVQDYTHSTAPNRRYPDVITQRLVIAALNNLACPYSDKDLGEIGKKCTEVQDGISKVERQLVKSSACFLLKEHIGEEFNAIVTGSSDKGIYVRLLDIPIEGRLFSATKRPRVGEKLTVALDSVEHTNGYIDFKISGEDHQYKNNNKEEQKEGGGKRRNSSNHQ